MRSSLASATAAAAGLPATQAATVLAEAQEAFVHAMQITTVTMACTLAIAAAVAWRIIPNRPIDGQPHPPSSAGTSLAGCS